MMGRMRRGIVVVDGECGGASLLMGRRRGAELEVSSIFVII